MTITNDQIKNVIGKLSTTGLKLLKTWINAELHGRKATSLKGKKPLDKPHENPYNRKSPSKSSR